MFTTIDVPSATFTSAFGISPHSDIVGSYDSPDGRRHGYLLSHGKFTPIDVPGATLTFAFGINPHGDIVGGYIDADGVGHGLLVRKKH